MNNFENIPFFEILSASKRCKDFSMSHPTLKKKLILKTEKDNSDLLRAGKTKFIYFSEPRNFKFEGLCKKYLEGERAIKYNTLILTGLRKLQTLTDFEGEPNRKSLSKYLGGAYLHFLLENGFLIENNGIIKTNF